MTFTNSLLLGAAGIVMYLGGYFFFPKGSEIRTLLWGLALLALFLFLLSVGILIYGEFDFIQNERRKSEAHTENVMIAEKLRFLKPETAQAFLNSAYGLKLADVLHLDNKGKLNFERGFFNPKRGEWIPMVDEKHRWNMQDFFENSTSTKLRPVGEYSDSVARMYAQQLTNLMIDMNLALPARGNQPASWIREEFFWRTRQRVHRAIRQTDFNLRAEAG